MSESFYGIKPCEMPKRVLMHYQSIEFDELPAETQNSIAAMIEVFRNLHLKGEWGWNKCSTPTCRGIRYGGQFLNRMRSVGSDFRDLHLPHRHVWTGLELREAGFKLTH